MTSPRSDSARGAGGAREIAECDAEGREIAESDEVAGVREIVESDEVAGVQEIAESDAEGRELADSDEVAGVSEIAEADEVTEVCGIAESDEVAEVCGIGAADEVAGVRDMRDVRDVRDRGHDVPAVRRPRDRRIPEATVARLPVYLRALHALAEAGTATVSSDDLAAAAGVNSAKVRKDLSHLGSYGTRGVGYDVDYLVYQISRELGLTQRWAVAIVGVGNLGHALANYGGFASRGFKVAALFDADPAHVGESVNGLVVSDIDDLPELVRKRSISIGVIATPAGGAQDVCDRLVAAGVTSILNFAPVVLGVPPGVDIRKVDLSIELQILAFHEQRKAARRPGACRTEGAPSPGATSAGAATGGGR